MRRERIVCVLLAVLTLGVYWPVQQFGFIDYDDPQFITENPQIKAGLTWAGVRYAFTEPVVGNWHPVTVLSHMLDCELFGPNPGAHHLVSVVVHTLNALLLFLILRALTGATWRSAAVAAIFALHPLRVESVVWISERKDVLSGFFFLLTLWAWVEMQGAGRSAQRAKNEGSGGSRLKEISQRTWLVLALIGYALGLMSKPMLVTLPFVLLLLDIWPLRRAQTLEAKAWWLLIREKTPFFALAAICSVGTFIIQRRAGAMDALLHLTFTDRLANTVEAYVRYLGKMVWPTKLSIFYPHPGRGYFLTDAWPTWQLAAAALLLVLVSVWCVLRLARQPYLAVGWFWFLGTLVPVIGLVQVGEQAMANRYTYIPLIGPAISLVWGLWDSVCLRSARATSKGTRSCLSREAVIALSVPCVLGLGTLAWLTRLQVHHWANTVSLFDYAVTVTPDNPAAQFGLGVGLEKEGQISRAMVQYRVALAIDPAYSKANYNLGQILSKAGDLQSAAAHFEAALRSNPQDLASRLNLANCLQRLSKVKEAIGHYEETLRRDPGSIQALNNLAWLLATHPDSQIRNGARAVELAERAVVLSESRVPVMIGTLAAAYAEAGRFADAIATGEKAAAAADLANEPQVAERNRQLVALYRANQPYHDPAP